MNFCGKISVLHILWFSISKKTRFFVKIWTQIVTFALFSFLAQKMLKKKISTGVVCSTQMLVEIYNTHYPQLQGYSKSLINPKNLLSKQLGICPFGQPVYTPPFLLRATN